MERINLHNYEAFFLDYLEGNLSDEQLLELDEFLLTHSELKDELSDMGGLDDLALSSPEATFNEKNALKADPTVLSLFTVDDWMIAAVENQLSASELTQLNQFVSANGLDGKFAAYQKTVLEPNEKEVFGSKNNLKRKPGLVIPLFYRYAAVAAAVILLIGLTVFNNNGNSDPTEGIETIVASNPSDFKTNFTGSIKQFENKENNFDTPSTNISNQVIEREQPNLADVDSIIVLPESKDPFIDPQIANNNQQDKDSILGDPNKEIKEKEKNLPENDDVAVVAPTKSAKNIVTEEPYKLFTNATGNFIKRPVVFTRDKEVDSDEYVAYHFKIGRFEFDRKKSK